MFNWFKKEKKQGRIKEKKQQVPPTPIELIMLRDAVYAQTTREILESLNSTVLTAAHNVLDAETSLYVKWISAEIIDSEYLVILGVCTFPEGHVLTSSDGNEITINKENQDYFKRLIRLGIPTKLVEEGDLTKLVKFIHDSADESLPMKYKESKVSPGDFSFDELTPEQKQQIRLFSEQSKDKVN